jgi:hypothetical protein
MTANYTITVKVEDSIKYPPGHVWLVYQAPGQAPVKVGFYPLQQNMQEFLQRISSGIIRDDSVSHRVQNTDTYTEPPAVFQREFIVNPGQFGNSLDYMVSKAQQVNDTWVVIGDGNQCTGIARLGLQAGNINLNPRVGEDRYGMVGPEGVIATQVFGAIPTAFINEVIGVPLDQRKGAASDPIIEATIPTKMSLLQSLASAAEVSAREHRGELPSDVTAALIEARIKPIGTVVVDSTGQTPTAAVVQSRVNAGLSPDGRDPLGVSIRDDVNTQHSWQANADGSVTRIEQRNSENGTLLTQTTYGPGATSPNSERQTLYGNSTSTQGIVYDAVLTPGSNGQMTMSKISFGSALLVGNVNTPQGFGTPARDSALFFANSGNHSVTVKSGGTVSDIWLKQKNNPGGFANDQEFYEAVLVSNPGITDINKVNVGQTIYVPQKQYDGSVTYHYAGGASVNTNKANGEYYMEVPNSSADGGSTVYERKLAGSEYVVRQTVTNAAGETVFYGAGKQETPDSELKDWFNYDKNPLRTVSSQVDGAGNVLEVTNNLDGTGTIKAYDEQLVETDSATFTKAGGMSATTGTITKLIDGQSVVFDASFGNFDPMSAPGLSFFKLTGIDSIGGESVLNDSMLNPLFSAGGFTLANVLTTGETAPLGLNQVKALVAAGDSTGANPTGLAPVPTTGDQPWYESDAAQQLGGALLSAQSLIASLKSGKPLAIATDTFNLAASASGNAGLQSMAQYLGYANSLANFAGAFERGDDLSAFMSGATIVKQYVQSQASHGNAGVESFSNGLPRRKPRMHTKDMTALNCRKRISMAHRKPRAP